MVNAPFPNKWLTLRQNRHENAKFAQKLQKTAHLGRPNTRMHIVCTVKWPSSGPACEILTRKNYTAAEITPAIPFWAAHLP